VRAAALGALAAGAVIAGGCGSSKAPVSKDGSVSTAAFIASADAVCRSSESALAPVLARESATLAAKPPKVAAGATALDEASVIMRAGVGRLRRLAEPAGDTRTIASMLGALAGEASALSAYARALRSRNTAAQATLTSEITAYSARYRGLARSYGFRRCGHG
jgi:hypothetical protein